MIRTVIVSAALCLAASVTASAQDRPYPMNPYSAQRRVGQVEANGRCDGLSFGTGARRCGTRTGGPVGGISGRN